jgi:RNA polymerase sigma-70 factor (ECF subfamily)
MEATPSDSRREAFVNLLCRNRTRLFGYIHSLIRNLADADDVFQQTALALWRRFDCYDPSRSFLNWALGVARLEAASWLRTRNHDRLQFSDEITFGLLEAFAEFPDEEISDRQAALSDCVEKLAEKDRRLVMECYLRETDVTSVAARLGRSAPSVHNSLRRIRNILFECIERKLARRKWLDMTDKSRITDRVRQLIDAYLDDRINVAELEELESLLRRDEAVRRYFARYAYTHPIWPSRLRHGRRPGGHSRGFPKHLSHRQHRANCPILRRCDQYGGLSRLRCCLGCSLAEGSSFCSPPSPRRGFNPCRSPTH